MIRNLNILNFEYYPGLIIGAHGIPDYERWLAVFNDIENNPKQGPSAKINAEAIAVGVRIGGTNGTLGTNSQLHLQNGKTLQGSKVRLNDVKIQNCQKRSYIEVQQLYITKFNIYQSQIFVYIISY